MPNKNGKLLEDDAGRGLGEAVLRLDRLIEGVKAGQAESPKVVPAAAGPNPLVAAGPDEAWAREFRTFGIGPDTKACTAGDLAAVPKAALLPSPDLPKPAENLRMAEVVPREMRTPMGIRIGKPERKRSWLGRLLRRRGG